MSQDKEQALLRDLDAEEMRRKLAASPPPERVSDAASATQVTTTELAAIELSISGRRIVIQEQMGPTGARLVLVNIPTRGSKPYTMSIPAPYVAEFERACRLFAERSRERHVARPIYQHAGRGKATP